MKSVIIIAIAFVFLIFVLGGVVYMGMNAGKYTGGFGEPSYISSTIRKLLTIQ